MAITLPKALSSRSRINSELMKITLVFAFVLALPTGSGWAQAPQGADAASNSSAGTTNRAAKEYLSSTALDAETREFKPGDTFQYVVEQDPSPEKVPVAVRVNDAGEAIFPVSSGSTLYVKVDVRSKKLAEIRRTVKELLDEEYYNDSTVRLEFTVANRTPSAGETLARVQVYGEMQGTIPLPEGEIKRISDAIIGLPRSQFADLRKVRLHRIDPVTGKSEIKIINVDKILRGEDRAADEILKDGDRIEVRPRTFNF